ncbi:MAG TPA: class I SAM-dependent methyltransferase [Labilithrix sp.]|nr:class I SAM-dependent methyltransferase [Labilithrix sp.]
MKLGLTDRVKRILPESVKGVVSNCGGRNARHERFAGHLARRGIPEEQYLAICHALIFPNGVRKTTSPGRNTELIKSLLDRGILRLASRVRVLEAAASAGLDALSTHAVLAERCTIDQYVLGDLHTHVLYDRSRGLVFDEDGMLLQVDGKNHFVSINFSYAYPFQRWATLPLKLRPYLLERRRGSSFGGAEPLERIPIAHPALRIDEPGTPFTVRRMDVFEPIDGRFDLIICLHLLVPQYFPPDVLSRGIKNLASALEVGGTLVTGSREYPRVITRTSESAFQTLLGDPP